MAGIPAKNAKKQQSQRKMVGSRAHIADTAQVSEEERRMEIIRQVLRRRNNEESLKEARERYLARREAGEIQPPFC